MRLTPVLLALLAAAAPARAGLHYSGETVAPLPSRWRGFLLDHRAVRNIPLPTSPLRAEYVAARATLEAAAGRRPLTADEAADLGALHVRLGEPAKAVAVLRPAAARFPTHVRVAANLGTAWQLAGDLDQAAAALEDAVRLAPEAGKRAERAHLALVRRRLKEGRAPLTAVDDLFGPTPPADALAVAQQLALWLPADGRLLWQLGELAYSSGDVRTAAAILDGCESEFGLAAPELRAHRRQYRAAADALLKDPTRDAHAGAGGFKSSRPLVRGFDESKLPAVRDDGPNPLPWAALDATTVGRASAPTFALRVAALDGKTVTLGGFLQPVGGEADPTGFVLVEYPIGCWFCESPDATGMVAVELPPGKGVTKGLVKVTGTLRLNRGDPEGFLFTVADARLGAAD